MTILTPAQKIQIFKHLFRGREDVFAMRWEKQDGSASGYTPVCLNEWKQGLCNKLMRKKCKDCDHKEYAQFSDQYIEQHLIGNRIYGIYPMLENNNSYFLAADFDGKKMFRNVITKLNPYFLYGFTATPERKNNDEKLIYIHLGEVLHKIETNYNQPKNAKSKTEVIIRETSLEIPFKIKADNFQLLYKIISFDSVRNKSIIEDVKKEADKGSKCLVLTERKEHVDVLGHYLKKDYEIIQLTGDLTAKQRKEKIQQIYDGNFQILLATGQLIGEGTDFPNLECLFLVYPFAFQGKLTQYIGRIQRGENKKNKIYDYRDKKVEYLERLFKKRLKYYQKIFGLK
ncbi:MAG: hypothetical protein A2259_00945 [Candidatus Moranbacteria bacterium RIFOXYA2_FULL_43_15]|nr:MAG: hypothetical protein A2259_00945 [Candidatus Moranbacteria bacterium RIFOXYA2_FULL_43_15]